ncbi:hypothetical protein QAD02_000643 [Eretmocerus hayati]|uniref:Uncharacterized protein n=1 Tax=Eretmocerus hayati TaxID=131215 RepID=A0ACC2NDT7_9HYME|nr:hypothetical protein QAD02_000643 [Eretmocerus hayati]
MLRVAQSISKEAFDHLPKGIIRLHSSSEKDGKAAESARLKEFRQKLKESPPLGASAVKKESVEVVDSKLRAKAPLDKLEELEEGQHPYQEKEPLQPFPNNVNPDTGEQNGPRGPEPTRYGDWERKGRVSDF